jgi:hypothetical protein
MPGATYYVLVSTNLALSPIASWNRIATNVFSADGQFTNNIPITPSVPQEFIVIASTTPVTVTSGLSANNKPYDGTTTATLSSNNVVLAGVSPADVGNVWFSTNGYVANFMSAGVGTNLAVIVGGLNLTGSAAGNYSMSQPTNLTADITAMGVTISSGITANDKAYDGTTTATLSSNNVVLAGVWPADVGNVWLSTNGYVANFTSAGVGTNLAVTVSGLSLTGSAAGNYSLSQPVGLTANITAPAPVPGLVAAYPFNEGSGTTAFDVSSNWNNGTISGATWTTLGVDGDALVFNGANALVTINNSASLQLSSAMTLEAWVNPSTANNAWRDVIYKGNDNYFLEGTSVSGGVPAMGGTFGTSDRVLYGTGSLLTNMWTHLAATYDGAKTRLYVNGVEVANQAQTGTIATSANPLQIGGDSIYGQYFKGIIDEVRVYNRALSATEIQADMNTPLGNIPTAPGNFTATVVSPNQVNLSWTASTGNLGVSGYMVERSQGPGNTIFAQIGATGGTSFADTGVVPGTNYNYRVRATDSLGDLGPYSQVVQAFTGLSISPRVAVLTPTQIQQFRANFTNVNVTWLVDGLTGGSMAVGTITPNGLYTPPNSMGTHTVTATTTNPTPTASAKVYVTTNPGVFTFHNDNFRTGENTNETVLSPANVNSAGFGKLFSYPLDGLTFASPLYVAGVTIPGKGTHNVVYVATEHDSLYAFDADGLTNGPLWQISFINPTSGVTTVPSADSDPGEDIPNEVGITSTPVIDPTNGTIYVVATTKEVSGNTTTYVQRLHALDIATGAEKFGAPVVIQATVAGTGPGSSGGQVQFDPLHENQRGALLLANGMVCFVFGSHGDVEPYYGWVLGYTATNVQHQVLVFNTAPNAGKSGIWMDGDGPAVDASSNLYFITADGLFDANSGGTDYGDSFIKLSPAGAVLDYFTPKVQAGLYASNLDLGAGGVLLLPDQSGLHPHEVVSASKNATIYLVDRDNMGHYHSNSDQIVQSLVNIFPSDPINDSGNFGSPVYFNGSIYFCAVSDHIRAFQLSNGLLSTSPTSLSAASFSYPGAMLAASGNGNANGILWAVQRNGLSTPCTLHAYDAGNLTNELYNSDQDGSRDSAGADAKWAIPLVVNGKVYVATQNELDVTMNQLTIYGLLP